MKSFVRCFVVLYYITISSSYRQAGNVSLYETPRSFSWSDSRAFCADLGFVLPPYEQVCPDGEDNYPSSPPLGYIKDTQ